MSQAQAKKKKKVHKQAHEQQVSIKNKTNLNKFMSLVLNLR